MCGWAVPFLDPGKDNIITIANNFMMYHKTKIVFIGQNPIIGDAIVSSLSVAFKISYIFSDDFFINDIDFHDIWMIDCAIENYLFIAQTITKKYGTMGATVILLGGKSNDFNCLDKPFHISDVFSLIRENQNKLTKYKQPIAIKNGLSLYPISHKICKQDICLSLTEKETHILLYLLQCGAKGSTKDTLLSCVWGQKNPLDSHTLETHISGIKAKVNAKFSVNNLIIFENKIYKIQ